MSPKKNQKTRITHDMVRELQELRRERGTLITARDIAEREKAKAEERAKKMSTSCLTTVSEYKRRNQLLVALLKKEAPAAFDKWLAEELDKRGCI